MQHRVQMPPLGDLQALAVEDSHGFLERLARSVFAQRQHAVQACLFRQLHHRRRTDDAAATQPGYLQDSLASLFQGGVGDLVNLHREQRSHGLQVPVDAVVAEQGDMGGVFASLLQRTQQVSAANTHRQNRTCQVSTQVGGSGASTDEHVGLAALFEIAGGLQGFGYRGVEHLDMDVRVARRQAGHQAGEATALPRSLKVTDQHDNLGKGRTHVETCSGLNCFDTESVRCKSETRIASSSAMEKPGTRERAGYRHIPKIGPGVAKAV